MPNFSEKKIFPYASHKIYELVMDIEKYPEFLPWCSQAKIINVIDEENLHADLLINFKGFFEKYRSNVWHQRNENGEYFIEAKAIEGPFRRLFSKWTILPIDEKNCQIEFVVDFEFNSIILEKIIGAIFEKASQKMVACFEERAKNIL